MPEILTETQQEFKAPEKDGKILTLTIKVSEGGDLGDLITKASALGEIQNLSLRDNLKDQYPYGYDY